MKQPYILHLFYSFSPIFWAHTVVPVTVLDVDDAKMNVLENFID